MNIYCIVELYLTLKQDAIDSQNTHLTNSHGGGCGISLSIHCDDTGDVITP